jgi:hypothetical protein
MLSHRFDDMLGDFLEISPNNLEISLNIEVAEAQWVGDLISPNATRGLIYILAGAAK